MIAPQGIGADTSYTFIIGALFVMGLGMGATMMPLMTSALKTLTNHEVARGSTLLNIVQQIASSVGAAVMSVLLTSHIKDAALAGPAIASRNDPSIIDKLGPEAIAKGFIDAANAFSSTFWVAVILVVLTFIPAAFLPFKHEESRLFDDADADEDAGQSSVALH